MKPNQDSPESRSEPGRKRIKSEWIILSAILIITGATAFLFTQNRLSRAGQNTRVATPGEQTPAPVPETPEGQ